MVGKIAATTVVSVARILFLYQHYSCYHSQYCYPYHSFCTAIIIAIVITACSILLAMRATATACLVPCLRAVGDANSQHQYQVTGRKRSNEQLLKQVV